MKGLHCYLIFLDFTPPLCRGLVPSAGLVAAVMQLEFSYEASSKMEVTALSHGSSTYQQYSDVCSCNMAESAMHLGLCSKVICAVINTLYR
jgi:hypothetical protein